MILCQCSVKLHHAAMYDTGFNPLSPHDALMHHFTYLKTGFIVLQLGDLERQFP